MNELEETKARVKVLEEQMSRLLKALDKFADRSEGSNHPSEISSQVNIEPIKN